MKRIKRQPTHPGNIMKKDYLEPLSISVTDMASKLKVSRKTLSKIMNGKRKGISFSCVIYAHQMKVSIGKCIQDLDLIAKVGEIGDLCRQRSIPAVVIFIQHICHVNKAFPADDKD